MYNYPIQVQLSFMPEKIRAAVTSKEITPEEHNLKNNRARTNNATSKDAPGRATGQTSQGDANGTAAIEQLDEEALKEIASESDLKMFKDAWKKAIEANEEVRLINTCNVQN